MVSYDVRFHDRGLAAQRDRIFALCLTPSAAIHLALLLSRGQRKTAPNRLVVTSTRCGAAIALLNSWSYFAAVETWRLLFRVAYGYVFVGALAFLVITGRALRYSESDLERSRLRVMFVGALAGFLYSPADHGFCDDYAATADPLQSGVGADGFLSHLGRLRATKIHSLRSWQGF